MKELVASFLFSALSNLFRNQPDLSAFTPHTFEREPNLSFHLANELWPYLFWLQCDFDVTKHPEGNLRPDLIFHRRGIDALNFLVVEVKREQNPDRDEEDLTKIRDDWLGIRLHYRFGASVVIDEKAKEFAVKLFENITNDPMLPFNQHNRELLRPVIRISAEHQAELDNLVGQIKAVEKADPNTDTAALRREIDERVCRIYGFTANEIKLVEEGNAL